ATVAALENDPHRNAHSAGEPTDVHQLEPPVARKRLLHRGCLITAADGPFLRSHLHRALVRDGLCEDEQSAWRQNENPESGHTAAPHGDGTSHAPESPAA